MATVPTITLARPAAKPAISRTHPFREPKIGSTRNSKKNPEQFDPDELARKLEAHIAEQKQQTERRRARANAKKDQNVYHHVPKVAAADFERTATSESMGPKDRRKKYMQRLTEAALEHQAKETAAQATVASDFRKSQVLDLARVQREIFGERNPFRRTHDLKDVTLFNERTLKGLPQRNFGTNHLDVHQTALDSRPLSTDDLVWQDDLQSNKSHFSGRPPAEPLEIPYERDPQDWAQRDEIHAGPRRSVRERVSPFLRKPNSVRMLKGKRDPKSTSLPVVAGQIALPGEMKHKKSMFLGLFRY